MYNGYGVYKYRSNKLANYFKGLSLRAILINSKEIKYEFN